MSSKQEEKDEELKLPWKKGLPGWVHILIHIGLIVVVSLLLLWGTMLFLKGYTRHGQAIKTPDVVGLTQENAMEILEQANLYLEVVDSVYVEGKAPGTILDTTPRAGSRIKPQRTIFATVNTVSVKSIKLPQFEEALGAVCGDDAEGSRLQAYQLGVCAWSAPPIGFADQRRSR